MMTVSSTDGQQRQELSFPQNSNLQSSLLTQVPILWLKEWLVSSLREEGKVTAIAQA